MFILDTNVVSELRKIPLGKADRCVETWADNVDTDDLYLSVITIQELETGVVQAERRDPQKGALLRAWLNTHVLPSFNGRILNVDAAIVSSVLKVPKYWRLESAFSSLFFLSFYSSAFSS